jgi:hypothetical protein
MNHYPGNALWKSYLLERLGSAVIQGRRNRRTQLLRRILKRPGR